MKVLRNGKMLNREQLLDILDPTFLKPDATWKEVYRFVDKVNSYRFNSVVLNCVSAEAYIGGGISRPPCVSVVVGFPLGGELFKQKLHTIEYVTNLYHFEAIEYVPCLSYMMSNLWDFFDFEVRSLMDNCSRLGVIPKVILETCYLTQDQKIKAANICSNNKVPYIKTSTGFGNKPNYTFDSLVEDVSLMRQVAEYHTQIKAAGGISTLAQVQKLYDVGATKIGTSNPFAIVDEFDKVTF